MRSAPFDGEGLPGARIVVFEGGVLRRLWGDARSAAYAGLPPTGEFGNITVSPGTTPLATLRAATAMAGLRDCRLLVAAARSADRRVRFRDQAGLSP